MEKGNVRYLSPQEVGRLIEAGGSLRDRTLLEFLYATAARVGEVHNVEVKDLNLQRRTVLLHGKTADRLVPFGRKAAKALRAYLNGRKVGYLFLEHKRPLSLRSTHQIVRKAGNRAGLKQINPIVLRHSCAVGLLKGGMNMRLIQELLGHSSPS